jgi:membrane protease subunit HflK
MPQTKIRNPFLHTHDHDDCGHDHAHGDGHHHHGGGGNGFEPFDPAQQSLADALRVSFVVLKWIMVLLFLAYLFTGIFRVTSQETAVRLRFGQIVGAQEGYGPGWHFGLPYPIEQKIMVPTVQRTVNVGNAFWFHTPPGGEGQTLDQMRGGPLNPERDGSLITADANVIHGRFQVDYVITRPDLYVQNVGDLALADRIVRGIAEQAILFAASQTDADTAIRRQVSQVAAENRMQELLNELQTGISIVQNRFSMTDATMPLPVRGAYQAVINAQNERARLVEEARQQRTSLLNETAGEAHDALFALVLAYEMAVDAGEIERANDLSDQIDAAFDTLRLDNAQGVPVAVGGRAATVINQAQTERVATVQRTRQEANTFRTLLARYRENPELVRTQLLQNAREAIFTGDVETIYADTTGVLTLFTNRDPDLATRREQERLRREQDAVRQNQQR